MIWFGIYCLSLVLSILVVRKYSSDYQEVGIFGIMVFITLVPFINTLLVCGEAMIIITNICKKIWNWILVNVYKRDKKKISRDFYERVSFKAD